MLSDTVRDLSFTTLCTLLIIIIGKFENRDKFFNQCHSKVQEFFHFYTKYQMYKFCRTFLKKLTNFREAHVLYAMAEDEFPARKMQF